MLPNQKKTIPKNTPKNTPQIIQGMMLMALAMLIIPGIDVFAKLLTTKISVGQIVWYRFFVQSLLLTPVIIALRLWHIPFKTAPLQIMRGLLLAAATLFFFAALKHLSIAQAIAIFFVEPLILTILSAIILGETIRTRRILAIIIGFIGAIIIIRPTLIQVGLPALYPLAAALAFALYMIATRKLTTKTQQPAHPFQMPHPFQIQWTAGLAATACLTPPLVLGHTLNTPFFEAALPKDAAILWVISLGLVATIGHMILVYALQKAPASLLAPFQYIEIIGATIFGYLVFGDGLDTPTIIGTTIIIASGLYLFQRERTLNKKTATKQKNSNPT